MLITNFHQIGHRLVKMLEMMVSNGNHHNKYLNLQYLVNMLTRMIFNQVQ
jgi:hypothetical protein